MGYEQPPGYRIPMQMPTIGKGVPDAVALQIWANWQAKYAPQMDFNALRIQARAARAWHPGARMREQDIIFHLKARGIGVLITDHNVRETLGICDRAYIINEGKVLASGRPDEIVYNDNVRRVYLGENFRM